MPLTASRLPSYDRGHRRRSGVRTYEIFTRIPTSHRRNLHATRRAIARPCIVDLARGVADQRIHNLDARWRRRGDAMTHWPQCRQDTAAAFWKNGRTWRHFSWRRTITFPSASMPWTWKNRLWTHARHRGCYSITSSAKVSIDGDSAIPSVALDLVEFEFGRLLDPGTSGGGRPLIS
jgi:hypothetical protein